MNSFTTFASPTERCECGTNHSLFDENQLRAAQLEMAELRPPVATLHSIVSLRRRLAEVATGEQDRAVIITGPCHEPVGDPAVAAAHSIRRAQLIKDSIFGDALIIQRDRGQNTKPRSNPTEKSPEGHMLPTFHGDAVNSRGWEERVPSPTRLLRAAAQASFVELELSHTIGAHVPAAHEFLNLAFEQPFLHTEQHTFFTTSADLPWIGVRNTDLSGAHFRLLSRVENPVGIKVGHTVTDDQIGRISSLLNRRREPGKLVWMLRLGLANFAHAGHIMDALQQHAPRSVLLFDIHGSTTTNEFGEKIRCVDDITNEIAALAGIARQHGMKLHGVHLETTVDKTRFECIDHRGQRPTHPGNIDPQLNPAQTLRVRRGCKGDFMSQHVVCHGLRQPDQLSASAVAAQMQDRHHFLRPVLQSVPSELLPWPNRYSEDPAPLYTGQLAQSRENVHQITA